jgi:hypothetical protein
MLRRLTLALFLIGSGAVAEQTFNNLQSAADTIKAQLDLANSLAMQINTAATSGLIVSDGTMAPAQITDQMVNDYNNAYQAVLDASYLTASDVLYNESQNALVNMSLAIDDLVAATTVLTTVATVADMAANATTTQQQLQAQAALETTDMTVSQSDVDAFNNAAAAVESYAQQAGAYMSASQDTNITGAIDSYAAANNVAVASYTAVSYTQSVDQFIIQFGTSAYLEFNGAFTSSTKSAEEIWQNVGYGG